MPKTPPKSSKSDSSSFAGKAAEPRQLKKGRYRSFKLQKRIVQADQQLPGGFMLLRQSLGLLWQHKKLIGTMMALYALVGFAVVQGFANTDDIATLKTSLTDLFAGDWSQLGASMALLVMLGTSGSSVASTSTPYQFLWGVAGSLAIIWTLRELFAQKAEQVAVRARDGFYRGMFPLMIVLLVLAVLALELAPATLAGTVFSTVMANGIAASGVEQAIWGTVCFLLILVSLYLVCSSIFALYIACLPDMTPIRALRSAHELVRNRRSVIIRRLLFLPLALFVGGGLVMAPLILYVPASAVGGFFVLNVIGLFVTHSYLYRLYRTLL